jgi:two-component system, cell cycle response regulator DivK
MAARILIIEDNKANLELAEYLLKASGYATLAARDGEEGVRAARKERPDLIICDLQMPIMDGYEVVRELKKDPQLRSIPVLAVTALSMPGDRNNVLSAGFDGYLSKPVDPETFARTVEDFLPAGLRARRSPGGS